MTRVKQSIVLISLILLLAACSPHPGSGIWEAVGENGNGFTKMVIQFNGRVEMFAPDKEKAVIRCFWAGEDAESISMDCVKADTDEKLKYGLRVNPTKQTADLLKSGKVVGSFNKLSSNPSR